MLKFNLYLTSFLSGAIVMALEILGFRLLAPYFGYSIYVWGSLLGVIMLSLALGYLWGGKLADKFPEKNFLPWMMLHTSLYVLIIYFFYSLWLESLIGSSSLIQTSLLASATIFGPPMFILGMTSPYVIGKLSITLPPTPSRQGRGGVVAGKIFALSTLGSLLGTFATAFYFLPELGTKWSLRICFLVLLILSTYGFILKTKKGVVILPLIFFILLSPFQPLTTLANSHKKILYDTESLYTRILVTKSSVDQRISLKIGHFGMHSLIYPNKLLTGEYWDYFNLGPILIPSPLMGEGQGEGDKNILLLGVAGGTAIKQLTHFFPDYQLDAVEIDPKIIEVGKKYFLWQESSNVHVIMDDARPYLLKTKKKYDVILIDVYSGEIAIPFYVTSQEFFRLVKEHVNPGGNIILNIADPSKSRLTSKPVQNTFASIFPTVIKMTTPSSNDILIGWTEVKSDEEIDELFNVGAKNFVRAKNLLPLLEKAKTGFKRVSYNNKLTVLTDDKSPIEKLTYQAMREYLSLPSSPPAH